MQTAKNITRIKIKNFMAISDLEITPEKITEIVGENSQGKTTILKAIETTFKGSTNGQLVKHGESEAELLIELPDTTTIHRKIKAAGGQSLTVRRGEFKVDSPQSYLEALVDSKAFNPIELLDIKVRKDVILNAINLEVTEDFLREKLNLDASEVLPPVDYNQHGLKVLEQVYNYIYSRRAEANKDALNKKNEFEVKSKDFTNIAPPTYSRAEIEIDRMEVNQKINAIKNEMAMAQTLINNNKAAVEKVARYETALANLEKEKDAFVDAQLNKISELEKQIQIARENLEAGKQSYNARLEDGQKYLADARLEIKQVPDIEPFNLELQAHNTTLESLKTKEAQIAAYENNQTAANLILDLKTKWEAAAAFADKLTARVDSFKKIKTDLMASAQMPIQNLHFKNDDFYIGDTPLDLISTADSVRLAVAVARHQAKKTKIICIDKFESLTPETRKMFIDEIKNDDFTYFMTIAGTADEGVGVITMQNGAAVWVK